MTTIGTNVLENAMNEIRLNVNDAYNAGVIDGIIIIDTLIDNNNIPDIPTLKEVIRLFIERCSEGTNTNTDNNEETKEEPDEKEDQEVSDEPSEESITPESEE